MKSRTQRAAAAVGVGAALLYAGLSTPAQASAPHSSSSTSTSSKSHIPTVVARMGQSTVHLSVGHRVHAGRVIFKVVAVDKAASLQIVRLHKGYTVKQAGADIPKAFGGDLAAIRRLDHRVTWLGGAQARPGHPAEFAANLKAAHLIALNQNSPAFTRLHVFGKAPSRPRISASSSLTAFTYGFGSPDTIANAGWMHISNVSDQPHFVVFQRVKDGTTKQQVRRYVKSQKHARPKWALPANTSTGVISPNRSELLQYSLPKGKYLLACFWPDDESGMPHFYMGMWKLITLK